MGIFRKLGFKEMSEMSIKEFRERVSFVFMPFYNLVIRLFNLELEKVLLRITRSDEKPELFPEIKESLEFLHAKGINLAVLTYHLQEELEKDIKDLGLQGLFIDIEGSVKNKKRAIIRMITRNKFKPEETIYFTDMVSDIKTCREARIRVIAITWGNGPRYKLVAANPDSLIDNRSEIKKIIL